MRTVLFTLIAILLLGANVSGQLSCIDGVTTALIDPWVNTVKIFPQDFLTESPDGTYEISANGEDFLKSLELEVGTYELTIREIASGETCMVNLMVLDEIPQFPFVTIKSSSTLRKMQSLVLMILMKEVMIRVEDLSLNPYLLAKSKLQM